ncbi:MAG TPA: site-specific integrase [Terracidiphilus sp.]
MTQIWEISIGDAKTARLMAKTRSGVEFNAASEVWSYRDGVKSIYLAFHELQAPFTLRQCLKAVLRWYAEHLSPSHLENLFQRFRHFAFTVPLLDGTITSSQLLNYRSTLNRSTEWYLGSLSGLLQRWHSMQIPGISDDSITLLENLRLKGNIKGRAVQTMDPDYGRFTDIELESIAQALKNGYDMGTVKLNEYVLTLLFIAFGQRPTQYAAMKVCDLNLTAYNDSHTTYILSIPRAKARGMVHRTTFKKRTLLPELGRLLKEYANQVRGRFAGILEDSGQAPMFPTDSDESIQALGFQFHRTGQGLAQWLTRFLDKLSVRSERTGKPIQITATRFRRTVGCRAADEGHGELVIAELLDHSDTQNVGVYIEATPGMLERIDRAVAFKLAPMAQAFAGIIIQNESQARRADDPTSRITDPRFDSSMRPIGNCGKFGFCGLLAPIACYTCREFQPWLDGPHERVLDFLIADRERLLSQTDIRIASITDRTILAVADVVTRCTKMKAEGEGNRIG